MGANLLNAADLQNFLAKIDGGVVAVDLNVALQRDAEKQASTSNKGNKQQRLIRVALDIEDCLDRFYGGYYSDWVCGGQWNRANQFINILTGAFNSKYIDLIIFFDGTLKKNKNISTLSHDFRHKKISVLKHIRMIGTPPPKIWWLPPSGIHTAVRNSLRSMQIQVVQTVNDHTKEVLEYFYEQKLDAILGQHSDYIVANVARFFSSHDLRLSYKGTLETNQLVISRLLTSLSLTADHLPYMIVFLGGSKSIDDVKMRGIYALLKIESSLDSEERVRKIAEVVRNSPITDINEFVKHLSLESYQRELKESVEYFQRIGKLANKNYHSNKSRNDFLKPVRVTDPPLVLASEVAKVKAADKAELAALNKAAAAAAAPAESAVTATATATAVLADADGAVGTTGEAEADAGASASAAPTTPASATTSVEKKNAKDTAGAGGHKFVYTLPAEVLKTALTRHQRGIMDPRIYQLLAKKEIILPQVLEDEQYREIPSVHLFYRPARQMIYAVLFNLYHQKYLCSKQDGGHGKKKTDKDGAATASGKNKKDTSEANGNFVKITPKVLVAEWVWSPQNEYKKPELVEATPLAWAVPTVQRLWFGNLPDDKQTRMRAFLTVMRSDSPLMLNRGYVPQHMLVMACVLRYIITSVERNVMTREELDAFLATAFSPQLSMVENTQKLVLPGVHLRGVYLATLFMQGVETAALANDACGVPLPWFMTNPWLFFDGKLFHLKLKMATYVDTIRELCDNQIDLVLKIERFRKAILEDVEHFLPPGSYMDPMYRPGFLPQPSLTLQALKKNLTGATGLHPMVATASNDASNGYLCLQPPYFTLQSVFMGQESGGVGDALGGGNSMRNQMQRNGQNRKGYNIKVRDNNWPTGVDNLGAAALFAMNQHAGNYCVSNGMSGGNLVGRMDVKRRNKYGNSFMGQQHIPNATQNTGRIQHSNQTRKTLHPRNPLRASGTNKKNTLVRNRKRGRDARKNNKNKTKDANGAGTGASTSAAAAAAEAEEEAEGVITTTTITAEVAIDEPTEPSTGESIGKAAAVTMAKENSTIKEHETNDEGEKSGTAAVTEAASCTPKADADVNSKPTTPVKADDLHAVKQTEVVATVENDTNIKDAVAIQNSTNPNSTTSTTTTTTTNPTSGAIQESDLASSMCDLILKDESEHGTVKTAAEIPPTETA